MKLVHPARLFQRAPLLTAAVLLLLVKSVQFVIDSQALFYYDSAAFILNATGRAFLPERSYVYSGLIRVFAIPFHSLRALVAIQLIMGGFTAWLLMLLLLRFLRVRPWISLLAALVFAFDPVQIVHEHMVMTETAAMLATAIFLWAALNYLQTLAPRWLLLLSLLGVLLVSLRTVYVPVVLASALLLPFGACFLSPARRPRFLAVALAISCGSTLLLQLGYQHLTGWLAGREPAYHYITGFMLLSSVAPIVEPGDSGDIRIAAAVREQNKSGLPLADPALRQRQLWGADGLSARLTAVFDGDGRQANQAALHLARAAIRRNPLGFLRLGMHNYLGYWIAIPDLRWSLPWADGTQPASVVTPDDGKGISSVFGAAVSKQSTLRTPSRRYHLLARDWYIFLLASPFLAGIALWLHPSNPQGVALLVLWNCLLLTATCLGGVESQSRYLHPFSFTGLAASAVLFEIWVVRARGGR